MDEKERKSIASINLETRKINNIFDMRYQHENMQDAETGERYWKDERLAFAHVCRFAYDNVRSVESAIHLLVSAAKENPNYMDIKRARDLTSAFLEPDVADKYLKRLDDLSDKLESKKKNSDRPTGEIKEKKLVSV